MSDLRQGVSEAAHRVLDLLDRARPGWAALDVAGLEAEIEIEAKAFGSKAAVVRAAALLIYVLERADAAGDAGADAGAGA